MTQESPNSKPIVRFGSRDLFVLVLVIAMACAWWKDHTRLNKNIELLELRMAQRNQKRGATYVRGPSSSVKVTPSELVKMVANANDADWLALQGELLEFRNSSSRHEAVPELIKLLEQSDAQVQARALSALSHIKAYSYDVIPAVLPLLEAADANVRWHAIETLGNINVSSSEVVESLTAEMNDDRSELASHATLTLKTLDPDVDIGSRLLELAQSPMAQNRRLAIRRLADFAKPTGAIPVLKKVFQRETDEEIKMLIAIALNRLEK